MTLSLPAVATPSAEMILDRAQIGATTTPRELSPGLAGFCWVVTARHCTAQSRQRENDHGEQQSAAHSHPTSHGSREVEVHRTIVRPAQARIKREADDALDT